MHFDSNNFHVECFFFSYFSRQKYKEKNVTPVLEKNGKYKELNIFKTIPMTFIPTLQFKKRLVCF